MYALLALALVAALAPPAGAAARPAGLRAGTCRRDITPVSPGLAAAYSAAFGAPATVNHTDPIYIAGFGNDRRATGYHDRLWARGVVIESRGRRLGLVAVDLIGYFENEWRTVRGLVSPDARLDFVVGTSTHQHEGPDTLGIWGPEQLTTGLDLGYLDFVNASAAACLDEAAATLSPVRLRVTTADSAGLSLGLDPEDDGFGVADGKVLAGDAAQAPETDGRMVDPRIAVMQLTTRRRPFRALATLVNFGSHPESLGADNTLVTADFPHYVRERIEAEYGGLAVWVAGAVGVLQGPLDIDVEDPATSGPAPRRTFRFAEVHGTQIAERVIEALGGEKPRGAATARLRVRQTDPVAIPLANPYFRILAAAGVLNPRRGLYTDGVLADPPTSGEDVHTLVSAFRLGRASVAVVPTELDPQIGETYRAAMRRARHTFLVGLGNDHIGYQLPADKWDDSCHACFVFVVTGDEASCPTQPIDCSTVFQNNVGQQVDPQVSGALLPLLDALH
jgi:hypothetical protein